MQNRPRRDASYRGKRIFDLCVLTLASGPALIVGALCAVAVRLTSRGSVFFRQQRVGLAGEPMTLAKFRTMVDDPDDSPFPDPRRITTVGRVLRRLSLDELPQLLSVVRGDMSIVGPRPTLAYQVERYTPRQRQRLALRPGITGLAQVRGRNAIAWAQRLEYDLEYLDRQSAWLDAKILWWTVRSVLGGSGVEGHPTDDPIARRGDGAPGAAP